MNGCGKRRARSISLFDTTALIDTAYHATITAAASSDLAAPRLVQLVQVRVGDEELLLLVVVKLGVGELVVVGVLLVVRARGRRHASGIARVRGADRGERDHGRKRAWKNLPLREPPHTWLSSNSERTPRR